MKTSVGALFAATGLLLGGVAFANAHLDGEHAAHAGHEAAGSTAPKAGMPQRHHGAQRMADPMMPMFGMLDENKDGKLSRDEVQKGVDKMFAEADANKDGAVTREEMQAHHKRMHEKMRDQMQSTMQERWKAADKDGDGALSRAEVDNADMPMMARQFERLDKNRDSKLTKDEVRSGMMPHRQAPAAKPGEMK